MRRPALAAWIGLTGLILSAASASAAEPIEGPWSMGGGVVELRRDGEGFTSHWVRQRPGILCPAIDDKDGDLRLEGRGDQYTGTWRWVLRRDDGACESVGRGPVAVTVAADGRTAQLEADAPKGYSDHESHRLRRAPERAFAGLERLSPAKLAAVPDLVDPLELSAPLDAVELAAVPRLEQLPFQGREPFVR